MHKMQSANSGIGVGLIGAGLVTQSIHVPVLARLSDRFHVAGVWDLDPVRANVIADVTGARSMEGLDDLLGDSGVDVVAICTPAALHAEHAIAAMRAGKRAVLVEKPLGNSVAEVEAILTAARETGASLIVGSMHLFDPGWTYATRFMTERGFAPLSISSRIVLPPNERFIQWAFEPFPAGDGLPGDSWTQQRLMQVGIMELAIHDLPLVRRLLPTGAAPRVTSAQVLSPFGYALNVEAGGVVVDIMGLMHGHWQPEWKLQAVAADASLDIEFTPSFVHAGPGRAVIHDGSQVTGNHEDVENGFVREWLELAEVFHGRAPAPDPDEALLDYRFACAIAEQAQTILTAGEDA